MSIQFCETFVNFGGIISYTAWENDSGTPSSSNIATLVDTNWVNIQAGGSPTYGGKEKVIFSNSNNTLNYRIRRAVADAPVLTIGCSVKTRNRLLTDNCIIGFKGGSTVISIGWNGYQPAIYIDGSLTSTSSTSFRDSQYIFFELKIDKSNGVYCYANGVEMCNATIPGGYAGTSFALIGLGSESGGPMFYGMYVNTGPQLGPVKIQEVMSYNSGDVEVNTWGITPYNPQSWPTPFSNTQYTQTDQDGAELLYDYVYAGGGSGPQYNTIPLRPEFTHTSVLAVVNKAWVASGGIGEADFSFRTNYSGSNYDAPVSGVSSTLPRYANVVMDTTPWDGTAWNATKVQEAFFGVLNG